MPFCNQNGIQGLYCPFARWKPIIPFWLQKGMKNAKFCINKFISWKYASRAFKIRSWNVYTTSGYDFMPIYVFMKKGQKIGGGGPEKKTSHFWRFSFGNPLQSLYWPYLAQSWFQVSLKFFQGVRRHNPWRGGGPEASVGPPRTLRGCAHLHIG